VDGLRRLMSYKLASHVLITFTEQLVPIHKHITALYSEFHRYQEQKQSQWNQRKRQRWSYLTTATLHIYWVWVSHWPRVIWKMDSGVLFHTYTQKYRFLRHKKRKLIVIHFHFSRSFFYSRDGPIAACGPCGPPQRFQWPRKHSGKTLNLKYPPTHHSKR